MNHWVKKGWRPITLILLLLLIWEVSSRWLEIPAWLLPSPIQIGGEVIASWPEFQGHLLATIRLTLIGFACGSSIGLGVATVLHLMPKVRETVYPLMIISQNIPTIVLAPLLVIWFGFGILPKVIVITLFCFFPIAIATMDGFRQTNDELKHYMLMAGASKGQIFRKLEWPHALPSIFSGLKIAATYSVMGAVISEWLGGNHGIGVFMTLASSSFRTDRVFVAILYIIVLCLLFFTLIVGVERRLIRWKTKGEGEEK
ncbi:ABC transporter permease [Radiobacillus kanasensis]|uniref:ABC transporter permease n=1 Tax=Radiobacillus kanasensis TaxID=2844358 RepID=UPI001E391E72|nr:ABC transporter permease [Radiobacillus kanasensis]UFT99636.1 ABC transporter permease [Radiobacillus kanasensis]